MKTQKGRKINTQVSAERRGGLLPAFFFRRVLRRAADFAGGCTPSFTGRGRHAYVLIVTRVCRELRASYVLLLRFFENKMPDLPRQLWQKKSVQHVPQRARPEGYEPGWVAGICASCGGRLSGSYVGNENSSRLLQGTSNFALPSLLSTRTATAAGTPPCSFTMSMHS